MSPMRESVTPVIRRVPALEDHVVPEPVQGDRQAVAKSDQEINVRHAPGTHARKPLSLKRPSWTTALLRPIVASEP